MRPEVRAGSRLEGLSDDLEHLLASALLHGLEAAEVESYEPDAPDRADGMEAEVRKEVAWEDRAVDEKSICPRLAITPCPGNTMLTVGSDSSFMPGQRLGLHPQPCTQAAAAAPRHPPPADRERASAEPTARSSAPMSHWLIRRPHSALG